MEFLMEEAEPLVFDKFELQHRHFSKFVGTIEKNELPRSQRKAQKRLIFYRKAFLK